LIEGIAMTAKLLASGVVAVAAIGAAATGITPVAMASTGPGGIDSIALGRYAQAPGTDSEGEGSAGDAKDGGYRPEDVLSRAAEHEDLGDAPVPSGPLAIQPRDDLNWDGFRDYTSDATEAGDYTPGSGPAWGEDGYEYVEGVVGDVGHAEKHDVYVEEFVMHMEGYQGDVVDHVEHVDGYEKEDTVAGVISGVESAPEDVFWPSSLETSSDSPEMTSSYSPEILSETGATYGAGDLRSSGGSDEGPYSDGSYEPDSE
jgi:hypothetical protein